MLDRALQINDSKEILPYNDKHLVITLTKNQNYQSEHQLRIRSVSIEKLATVLTTS